MPQYYEDAQCNNPCGQEPMGCIGCPEAGIFTEKTCWSCHGHGEVCAYGSEKWTKCPTCNGRGYV